MSHMQIRSRSLQGETCLAEQKGGERMCKQSDKKRVEDETCRAERRKRKEAGEVRGRRTDRNRFTAAALLQGMAGSEMMGR